MKFSIGKTTKVKNKGNRLRKAYHIPQPCMTILCRSKACPNIDAHRESNLQTFTNPLLRIFKIYSRIYDPHMHQP